MSESLKDKSLKAFFWVLADKMGGSVANFLITIFLARMLTPADFGLVAMILVFFEISSSFIESGLGYALIREKTITEVDKATAFYFNLVMAVAFYALLYWSAPAISAFFNQPALTAIVRIMGLNLIVRALSYVQHTVLLHRVDFRTQTLVRFSAVLVSGTFALVMAYYGWGVWSLVARIGVMDVCITVLFWYLNPWKIAWQFSIQSFRKLFGFGSVILAEALIDKFFRHLVQLLMGKFYSAAILGLFTQANNFCNMAVNNLSQTLQKLSYPILAKLRDDHKALKQGYRRMIVMSSFIIMPVMVLMGVLAGPILTTFAGEKWLPATLFLQLLCVAGAVYHVNAINLDMLLVLGRTDLSLRLEIIKKIITAIAIIIGIQFGVYGLIIGQVISTYLALFINTYYSDKLLKYALSEQLKDVFLSFAFSAATGAAVFFLQNILAVNTLPSVLLVLTAAMGFYIGLHWLARTEEIGFVRTYIVPQTLKMLGRNR
ncbi:MAG: lipopolysaccharide biosynthesis protein [Lewinellaceae bacterium]|nr:lipopolysaccharide biosynthesis protein [Lewinellaceae bacterium]